MKKILKPKSRFRDDPPTPTQLQEVAVLPSLGETVSVRSAKAHLSALLNLVEGGREIVITSDGKPKARLAPIQASQSRKRFPGSAEHLATMPAWQGGATAEDVIRADRDGRGW